jgi:hypothetical protein
LNREVIELKCIIEELQEKIKIIEKVAIEKKVNAWSSLNRQDERNKIIGKLKEEVADLKS